MKEADNILRILEDTQRAIQKQDYSRLKHFSNQTINTASRTHDPDNILLAVVVYALGKIYERENYRELEGWAKYEKILNTSLNNAIFAMKKGKHTEAISHLELMRDSVGKLSGKLKDYINDVFRRASINKASRMHEHGISMERTAKLLGITMWELADYVGDTGIADTKETTSSGPTLKSRIKLAMELFG